MTRDKQNDLLRQVDRLGSTKPLTADDIPDAAAMRLYQEVRARKQDQEQVMKILSLFAIARDTDRRCVTFPAHLLSGEVRKLFLDKGYRIESANPDGLEIDICWD
jgi:hypothetical protein